MHFTMIVSVFLERDQATSRGISVRFVMLRTDHELKEVYALLLPYLATEIRPAVANSVDKNP